MIILVSPFRLVDGMPSAFSTKRREADVSSLAVRRDRRAGAVASSTSPVGMVQWCWLPRALMMNGLNGRQICLSVAAVAPPDKAIFNKGLCFKALRRIRIHVPRAHNSQAVGKWIVEAGWVFAR